MSYVSQFLSSGSGGGGGGGSKPIGALELFAPNMGDTITLPDNTKYLRGGVIGRSTDYPNVPAVFLKQLSPMIASSNIGSGGIWRGMAIDTLGYPMVLSCGFNYGSNTHIYRIVGASSTSNSDVTALTSTPNSYPGSFGLGLAVTNNTIVMGLDYATSAYGSGPITLFNYAPGASGASNQSNTSGASWSAVASTTNTFAAIGRGTAVSMCGSAYNIYTQVNLTAVQTWTAAAANSLRYVAIASGSATMNYSNGLSVSSWAASTMPSAAQWISVASNGTGFVAIATNGTSAATSTNGITWASSTLPLSQNWTSICWANLLGQYVAVARGSNVGAMSADGSTWTTFTLPKAADWETVVYSAILNRLFVCSSDGSGIWMSSDGGVTWTEKRMPRPITFDHLEYSNGAFYAMQYATAYSGAVNVPTARSTDGINWTYRGTFPNAVFSATGSPVKVFNGVLYALQSTAYINSASIRRSTDNGVTWLGNNILSSFSYGFLLTDLAYNGTRFVAVMNSYNDGSEVQPSPWVLHSATSTNTSWTVQSLPVSAFWTSITYGNGAFVMAGYSNATGNMVITRSTDGITWTVPTSAPTTFVNYGAVSVTFDPVRNMHLIGANYTLLNGVLMSTDGGLTWNVVSKAYGGLVQSGSRYVSALVNSNNTYDDAQAVSLYANYAHGLNIKPNTTTVVANFTSPVYAGTVPYFFNDSTLFTVDSTQWVDNRGAPNESSGQGVYYMRVN